MIKLSSALRGHTERRTDGLDLLVKQRLCILRRSRLRHYGVACVYLKHVMFWLHQTQIRQHGAGLYLRLCLDISVSKLVQGAVLRTERGGSIQYTRVSSLPRLHKRSFDFPSCSLNRPTLKKTQKLFFSTMLQREEAEWSSAVQSNHSNVLMKRAQINLSPVWPHRLLSKG